MLAASSSTAATARRPICYDRRYKNVNPKIVQEMMGHASITQTMNTYSHVIEGMQEEAAERLRDHLFEQK